MSSSRPAAVWSYRPELDGLRTFAVVVIILYHARVQGMGGAFIALDLFFVLSGFLVTNVVLSEIDQRGRLDLPRYYARRVRRLLPAAVVAIVVISVVFVLVASQPERLSFVRQAQAALLYLANWQFIAESRDYFTQDASATPFMHFWSLSIEEQYYVFFPLLIMAVHRFAPGSGRVLLGVLLVLIGASVTSQVVSHLYIDPVRAYYATDARLYQLLAGAALAVALREFVGARSRSEDGAVHWPRAGTALAVVGLLGYALFGFELLEMSTTTRNIIATFLALALVCGFYSAAGSPLARVFARPTPVYLGRISYGTYLWHWPLIIVVERVLTVRPLAVAVIAGVLATALAALSDRLLETPIRRARVLDAMNWRTVGAGLAASVVTAVVVVAPILTSDRTPSLAAGGPQQEAAVEEAGDEELSERLSRPVPKDIDYEAVAEDRGPRDVWCTPGSPEDCLMVDGDGPHVLLVGDSHARVLATAFTRLAEEKGFRLSGSIVPGCPWQDGLLNGGSPAGVRERCEEARTGFYDDTVREMEPDLVVVVGYDRGEGWDGRLVDAAGEPVQWPRDQYDAIDRTAEKVGKAGAGLVMVRSLLGTGGWHGAGPDPLDCLARAKQVGDCAVVRPNEDAMVDGFFTTVATLRDNASTIDVNSLVCPDGPVCSPLRAGELVWRNHNHLTGAVVRELRDGIWREVRATGLLE